MMKRFSIKLRLLIGVMLMAFIFPGYTYEYDKDFGFGEIDKEQYVYDYAGVYDEDEEEELQELCEKIGKKLDLDIVILTSSDLGFGDDYVSDSVIDSYERQYAETFYLSGGFDDGILYLLDLDYDGIYVTRSGMAEVYMDDGDHEKIRDEIWEEFLDYDYFDAAEAFVDEVEDIVAPRLKDKEFIDLKEAWDEGEYVYYDDFLSDYRSEIKEAHKENLFTVFKNPFMCIMVGAVIGLITIIIALVSSGTHMKANSRTYMKNGSFRILQRFDRYTHTTTRSYKVESSSGGGSGGLSSSHRSSFGGSSRSFSGGGRRR